MKKLLFLLFVFPFLFSCSSDEEEKFLDMSIIEGAWLWEDGLRLNYIVFGENSYKEFLIDRYTGELMGRDNLYGGIDRYVDCWITKDKIYSIRLWNGKRGYAEYELKNDSTLLMRKVVFKRTTDDPLKNY